jgi:hypothetical protein
MCRKLHELLRILGQEQFEVTVLVLPRQDLMLFQFFEYSELVIRAPGQAVDFE